LAFQWNKNGLFINRPGKIWLAIPKGLKSFSPGLPRRRDYPYMLLFVFDFSSLLHSLWLPPLGGLWNEGERSEPSGTTRPAAEDGSVAAPFGIRKPALFNCCVRPLFLLSLPRQGTEAGIPAQGTPAGRASSFNPRMATGQSEAQHEPRASSAPNSNRCLSRGPGHELACIRLSVITLTCH